LQTSQAQKKDQNSKVSIWEGISESFAAKIFLILFGGLNNY